MKYSLIIFMRGILNFVYMLMKKIIKNKKKIVYLSRQSEKQSLDMKLLSEKIREKYPECEQVFRLRVLKSGVVNGIKYILGVLGDMYHIAGASVAICDTYSIPISCLKHKECLTVIQIWHAMGAVKKFGLQSVGKAEGRDEKISKAMRMHQNYDYVIAPSSKTGRFYEEAFGVDKDKIVIYTLPRIDYVCDGKNRKQDFIKQNPEIENKEIILYLPTFREGEEKIVKQLYNAFKGDAERKLIISLHPLSQVKRQKEFEINGDFSTYDLMKIADQIITDYSACAFEASLLSKPLWFYVPDYNKYEEHRGLNINLKNELGKYVFSDCDELHQAVRKEDYDFEDLRKFQYEYVANKENCTEKLATFVYGNI